MSQIKNESELDAVVISLRDSEILVASIDEMEREILLLRSKAESSEQRVRELQSELFNAREHCKRLKRKLDVTQKKDTIEF